MNSVLHSGGVAIVWEGSRRGVHSYARVNRELLEQRGLIKGRFDGIKILGRGKLTKSLTVEAHKFSATARQQIEAAGGSVVPVT